MTWCARDQEETSSAKGDDVTHNQSNNKLLHLSNGRGADNTRGSATRENGVVAVFVVAADVVVSYGGGGCSGGRVRPWRRSVVARAVGSLSTEHRDPRSGNSERSRRR